LIKWPRIVDGTGEPSYGGSMGIISLVFALISEAMKAALAVRVASTRGEVYEDVKDVELGEEVEAVHRCHIMSVFHCITAEN
jgi:hypothetical protein